MLKHATHPRTHSHATKPGTAPIQLPNRSLLVTSQSPIPSSLRRTQEKTPSRSGSPIQFHSSSPHPPRHQIPPSDPIKLLRQTALAASHLRARPALIGLLTFVATHDEHSPRPVVLDCGSTPFPVRQRSYNWVVDYSGLPSLGPPGIFNTRRLGPPASPRPRLW